MDGMSLLLAGLAGGANPLLAGGGWCFQEHFETSPGGLGWHDCAGNGKFLRLQGAVCHFWALQFLPLGAGLARWTQVYVVISQWKISLVFQTP